LKKHLNTLFLTKPGSYIHRERETLVVEMDKVKVLQLPVHTLESIVCMSNEITLTSGLMQLCSEHNITLAFYDDNGRFISRLEGPIKGNILLRKEQYRKCGEDKESLKAAKFMVCAKITNSKTAVHRCMRNYPGHEDINELERIYSSLNDILCKAKIAANHDELMGYEGEASVFYFKAFNYMLTTKDSIFQFKNRNRRPPLDPINALLSFSYTLLMHDSLSALEGVGLDPASGFLHKDRPGRMSLALDIMEEFRSYLCDRLVLSLINLNQVKSSDFTKTESGAVKMSDDAKKILISAYQKRKQDEIMHPFIEEKTTIGMLLHIQARLLSRYIRGDYEFYPAFIVK
jgi:CRISPR-associated protein Cas1